MGSLVFQAWDEDDLNGTPLATLTTPSEKSILMELYGVGAGEFNISRHSSEVNHCRPGRYITVHLDSIANAAFHGFFVEESRNIVLSENEQGAEVFHRSGPGAMSVLTDAIVWYKAVTDSDAAVPTDDSAWWQWTAAMNAHPPGVMVRMLEEAQARGCFPFLTYDFTRDEDSDGNPWTVALGDFRLDIGTDLLTVAAKIQRLGFVFVMDPDFVLHCYEAEPTRRGAPSFGTDLSGSLTFEAAVNIATAADQQQAASAAKSSVLVRGTRGDNGATAWVEANSAAGLAEVKRRKEALLDAGDATGFANLQTMGLESIYSKLRLLDGASYLGVYDTSNVPFTDYNLGDTVLVDVPGVWDEEQRVIHSIGFTDTASGEYDVIVGFDQSPGMMRRGFTPGTGTTRPPSQPPVADGDMTDRALSGTMTALSSGGQPSLVQYKVGSPAGGGGTVTLDDAPTPGSLLVAWLTGRDDHADSPAISSAGWTTIAQVTNTTSFVRNGRMAIKVSNGADGFIATPGGHSGAYQIVLMEWVGSYASVFSEADTVSASTDMNTGGSLAATDDSVVIGCATLGFSDGDYPGLSVSPDSGTDEVYDTVNDLNFSPGAWVGYREVTSAGTETVGGTLSASKSYCGVAILLEGSTGEWVVPAGNANDEDDATYVTVTGTDLIRVDLGAAHRIVRTRIRIAATNAGARTFTIKGANEGDFSDEATLATIAFTATGGLTAQDVTGIWITGTSYRFFELSIGTSDTYRVHTWSLYEQTPGSIVVTDPTDGDAVAPLQDVLDNIEDVIAAHEADSADAHDASAISIVDAGAYYTGTDVEAALQEVGVALATSSSAPPSILLESGSSVPFAFDEILQESDGSDFLWASE